MPSSPSSYKTGPDAGDALHQRFASRTNDVFLPLTREGLSEDELNREEHQDEEVGEENEKCKKATGQDKSPTGRAASGIPVMQ